MRSFVLFVLVACGGKQNPGPPPSGSGSANGDPPGVAADTRTELEKRRDAACQALRPKLYQCAVDDAKAQVDAGTLTKKEYDQIATPEVREKHGSEWLKGCRVEMSSRQVRVLEVCFREEQQCGPLASCLEHLQKKDTL